MDKYFYSVEQNGTEKVVHILGNIHFNDADETETDHRVAEFVGFCITIPELIKLRRGDLLDFINEKVEYLSDVTENYAAYLSRIYFDGEPGTELSLYDVLEETPCGNYWFDAAKAEDFDFYSNEHVNTMQTYIEEHFEMGGCSATLVRNILSYIAGQAEDADTALLMFDMLFDGIGLTREEIIKTLTKTDDTSRCFGGCGTENLLKKAKMVANTFRNRHFIGGNGNV